MIRHRPILRVAAALVFLGTVSAAAGGRDSITGPDLKVWLTYIASDELEGRELYTTGIGLAAAYIENQLRAGVRPAGDKGSYLQTVRVLGVKSTNRSTLTVEVGGETRTFADGQGIAFPKNVGGTRRLTVDRVEFAGYGLDAPAANHMDYRGADVKGAAVVWLGSAGPKGLDAQTYRRLLTGRNRYATDQLQAVASIGPELPPFGGRGAGPGGTPPAGPPAAPEQGGRGGQIPAADFTTVQQLDTPLAPTITAKDELFEFLFSHAPAKYVDLKRLAEAQEPLPKFRLDEVRLTFNLDADYEVVRTQLAQNVVGIVPGSDPKLNNTNVAFGARYDGASSGRDTSPTIPRFRSTTSSLANSIFDTSLVFAW